MFTYHSTEQVRLKMRRSRREEGRADLLLTIPSRAHHCLLPRDTPACAHDMLSIAPSMSPGAAYDILFAVGQLMGKDWVGRKHEGSSWMVQGGSNRSRAAARVLLDGLLSDTPDMADLAGAVCVGVSCIMGAPPTGRVKLLSGNANKEGYFMAGVSCEAGEKGLGFVCCSLGVFAGWLSILVTFAEVIPPKGMSLAPPPQAMAR